MKRKSFIKSKSYGQFGRGGDIEIHEREHKAVDIILSFSYNTSFLQKNY
jgi:hypothetical protein